tara:strand:+ start:392 stop:1942 length:1551 start_codon:yes stop_codon:yes gene_type:complete
MANLNTKLQIKTGKGQTYGMEMSDTYTEVYQNINKVDNTDAFITLASLSKSNASLLKGSKLIVIKNNSPVGVELQLHINEFNDSTNVDQYTEDLRITQLLGANEYMVLPNQYMIGYATDESASMAKTIDNKGGYDVATTLEVDSTADIDTATDGAIDSGTTTTTLYLEPYTNAANCTANLFRVGDLIRLQNEICEVTAIGDKTDLANNYLTIRRGLFGSTAATHADDVSVDFPFFNTQSDYDTFTYSQTNASGKFTSQNLFSYGRSLTYPTGIVKGSFAMKFYSQGYQELGLSGVTSASNSGLTASTAYQFQVAVDGGSAYDVDVTTDASDLSVGKVLSLIQAQFDTAYYASSGNLKDKRLTVGIVNGDIRFTSGQRTRASAVALSDSGGGDTDIWGVGIIPAVANVETAVPALLPDDTVFSKDTYISSSNVGSFSYDDGKGNITGGEASGTINYETGALALTGPANAEFVVSFNYDSAHSGGINASANQENGIVSISGRSVNSKIDAEIEILGFV